ncbi:P-II family nitrogen regulator [Clostridium tetani]|uniref:P-II family nitrogen regulator n=1 Tax=Clostridium tetani TaxID=1513 RepID=A0ABY0ELF0_CLOTA|nr:P-II family nitrogen regulator [Clostridium tetani]RXI51695.1 P-II family nitrogen regulator [Clostridium tetani]RXI74080.1 P-II family nitrogen regulator [Clostridium tetani]
MSLICIITIVERGKANSLVDQAKKVGAKGATIFYGRGTGDEEIKKYFNFHIESSKEIIIILADDSRSQEIIDTLVEKGGLNNPGRGILFTFPISKVIGIG